MKPTRLRSVLALIVLTAMVSCGGVSAVPSCDPAAQNCPPGMTCDLVCSDGQATLACRQVATTASAIGQACGQDRTQCAHGSGCFARLTPPGNTCVGYCNTNADCATGTCRSRASTLGCGAPGTQFTLKFCL